MRVSRLSLLSLVLLTACGAASEEPFGEPLGVAAQEEKICAGPATLEGIDVSHWQGTIDWAKVKQDGRVFAIIKATEHTTFVDDKFATNWAAMKANGIVRGAYHFYRANKDPIAQADHFLQVLGTLEVGDLPPTLDLETYDGASDATITTGAIAFLDHVAAATGTKPILYTGPSFITSLGNEPIVQELDKHATLWVANWGASCPTVPPPFTGWGFWQYDNAGSVQGIAGGVDVDQFNGSLSDLMALTVQAPSTSSSSSSTSSSTSGGGGDGGAGGEGGSAGSSSGGKSTTTDGAGGGGGEGGSDGAEPEEGGGCGCAVPGREGDEGSGGVGLTLAMALLAVGSRRRSRR